MPYQGPLSRDLWIISLCNSVIYFQITMPHWRSTMQFIPRTLGPISVKHGTRQVSDRTSQQSSLKIQTFQHTKQVRISYTMSFITQANCLSTKPNPDQSVISKRWSLVRTQLFMNLSPTVDAYCIVSQLPQYMGHSVSSGLVAMQAPSLIWLILL